MCGSKNRMLFFNSELARKITKGMERSSKYKNHWQSVNLNDFVEKFTPDPIISVDRGKLTFTSKDGKMAIIADLGGTYCKLADIFRIQKWHEMTRYLPALIK